MNEGQTKLFELWIPRRGIDWLTANTVKGAHRMKVARIRTEWKTAVWAAAVAANVPADLPPAILYSEFRFTMSRTRDPLNFADTLKPIVDYLIKQRRCWPDDNPTWLDQLAPVCVDSNVTEDGVLLIALSRPC